MSLKRLALSVMLCALLCGTTKSIEAKELHSRNVTPYLGYHFINDHNRNLKDNFEFGVLMEYRFNDNISLEPGIGGILTSRLGSREDVQGITYRLNGNYNFTQLTVHKFMPYLTVGIGGDYIKNKNTIGFDGGFGLKYLLNSWVSIRTEAREVFLTKGRDDFIVIAGLSFAFGGKKEEVREAPPVKPADSDGDGVPDNFDKCPGTPIGVKTDVTGCPIDSDGDGVPDYLDKCPDTLKGKKVDVKGCIIVVAPKDSDKDSVIDDLDKCPGTLAGVKTDVRGCPVDSDGDGVPDYLDKCPDTPKGEQVDMKGCTIVVTPEDSDNDSVIDDFDKCPNTPDGVKVDEKGCPLDSDGDGIPNYIDKCHGTPIGVHVDAAGCPLDTDGDGVPDYLDKCQNSPSGSKVDTEGCVTSIPLKINFDNNKAVIKEEYYAEIKRFADFMKDNISIKAEIQGHTDNRGNDNTNMKLSNARANAVMKVLTEKFSVSPDRISAKGYGESKPAFDNNTPEGRVENRRVEAVVIK